MDEKQYIDKSQWTSLHGDIRFKLRKEFGINLTEQTNVVNDTVISDGVSQDSLRYTFSVPKMRAYLSAKDGTCDELFRAVIERVKNPEQVTHIVTSKASTAPIEPVTPEPAKVEKKKRTRK